MPETGLSADERVRADLLLRLAQALFVNGQDTGRTLAVVAQLARSWRADWVVRTDWGRIELLMRGEGRPMDVDVRVVVPVATNMLRVMAVMAQTERLSDGASIDSVRVGLAAAALLAPLNTSIFAAAAGLAACALAIVFGETDSWAFAVIAAAAVVGGVARRGIDRLGGGLVLQDLCAAFIAGLAAALVGDAGLVSDFRLVALCPCMILIPGPHLLNGAIDLLANRVALGWSRLVFALLGLVAISAGLALGLAAGGHTLPAGEAPATVAFWKDSVAGGVAAACYAVFYAIPLSMLVWPAATGFLAHALHWGAQAIGFGAASSATVASFLAGLLLLPTSRRFHLPFAGVGFAAIVSMLPGIFIFPMSSALLGIAGQGAKTDPALVATAIGNGVTALLVILGMTVGLITPKLGSEVWRHRPTRHAIFPHATGVLDA